MGTSPRSFFSAFEPALAAGKKSLKAVPCPTRLLTSIQPL
ncbi:conserved hypothetical protein [delta proteobacterium NaphS2]|nr:conserved hypothetical protein [delta proteobacterium NaphS2]